MKAAIVFFIDQTAIPPHKGRPRPPVRVALQRKDWMHPNPAMRNRISSFGGIVEAGESALQCVVREVGEELPGWQDGLDEAGRYREVGEFPSGSVWTWIVYTAQASITPETFRRGCQVCTEGMFEVHGLEDLLKRAQNEPQDFLPGLAAVLLSTEFAAAINV